MKGNARKVRRLHEGKVIAGFAGGTADAFTLFERFEAKLSSIGNLTRAAIELAKDWRTDRSLRRLEALLIVADATNSFMISGNGDVIEPEHDLLAIGSGGAYAQAAAQALLENTELDAREIVEKALTHRGATSASTRTAISRSKSLEADSGWRWIADSARPETASTAGPLHDRHPLSAIRCPLVTYPPSAAASHVAMTPEKSSRNSTSTSSARTPPSARWRWRCATAGAACRSRKRCATRSRRRTS